MTRKNLWLRALAGSLLLCSSTQFVRSDTFEWTDAVSGDFDAAGNWTLVNGGGPAPPGTSDLVQFNEPGIYTVTFNADEASIALTHSAGDVTFRGGLAGQTYNLTTGTADAAISGGNLDLGVSGAPLSLNIGDRLFVRDGSLDVNFGSDVTTSGIVTVGTAVNDGIITVDNSTIDFGNTVQLGLSGNAGTLTLQNGSTGNIDGTTQLGLSTLNNTKGFLNVLSGSTLTAGSLAVGQVTGTTGQQAIVTVDGVGSMLTQSGASTLVVGEFGNNNIQAELNVTGSGIFNAGTGATTIQKTGLLNINSGGTFNANGSLAVQTGATLLLDDGAVNASAGLDASSGILDFRNGDLTVTGGAFVPNAGGVTDDYTIDGLTAPDTPRLTIGTGASASIGRDLFVGNVNQGELTIQNGGLVDVGDEVTIGGVGTINIINGTLNANGGLTMTAGSTLTLNGGALNLPAGLDNSAAGTLDFLDGTITVTGGAFSPNAGGISDDFAIDGPSVIETPHLTIGAGATVNLAGDIDVGTSNQGELTITDGGTVSSAAGSIEAGPGLASTVTVDGVGSSWTMANSLTLQSFSGANATLNIQNGGTVSSVGGSISGSSTATVDGVGSTWMNSGGLSLSSATLSIMNGGAVTSSTGSINDGLSNTGQVTIDGAGSTWTITSTTSTFNVVAPLIISNGGAVSNARSRIGSTISDPGTVTVDGTGSSWIHSISLSVTDGELDITNGGAVSNTDGVIGNDSGRTGTVTVDGVGSSWTNTGSLSIGGSATVASGTGTLNIQNSGFVQADSTFKVWTGGTVNLAGGTLLLNGPLEDAGGTFNFTGGTLLLNGPLEGAGGTFNFTGGVMNVNDATTLLIADGSDNTVGGLSLGSSFVFNTGQTLNLAGTARVDFGGQLTLGGGTLSTPSLLVQTGGSVVNTAGSSVITSPVLALAGTSINVTGGDLTIGNTAAVNGFYSNGSLSVAGGSTLTLEDSNDAALDTAVLVTLGDATAGTLAAANGLTLNFGGNVTGFGTVNTPDNVATPLINNGHIVGNSLAEPITLTGYVKGVGTLDNVVITGTDAPGFSPSSVTRGSVAYDGILEIELGGTTVGSHDQVNHILGAGIADLGGVLDISLINGFLPFAGDTFEIITAANILGEFDAINLPTLPGDLLWFVNYGATSVEIVSTYAADFDEDGSVDNLDLAAWKDGFGNTAATHMTGDANANALASGFDFLTWQRQFGSGSGASLAAATTIPEPSSCCMLLIGLIAVSTMRRQGNLC